MALQQSELHVGALDPAVVAVTTPILPRRGDSTTSSAATSWASQIPLALCIFWLLRR